MKKLVTVAMLGLVGGFALSESRPVNWPGAVSKWWNAPPSGSSDVTNVLSEQLDDVSAWRVVTKEEQKLCQIGDYESITNGRVIIRSLDHEKMPAFVPSSFQIRAGKDGCVSETLGDSEKAFLFEKARKIYQSLRYEEAAKALKE